MQPEVENLERLISRFLDNEASPNQRRALDERLRGNPAARALLDEYTALDREAASALRHALGPRVIRPISADRLRNPALRWGATLLATAAAVALFFAPQWRPLGGPGAASRGERPVQAATAWFSDQPAGDACVPAGALGESIGDGARSGRCDLIFVPGARTGEFLIIEVNRAPARQGAPRRSF